MDLNKFLSRLFGTKGVRDLKAMRPTIAQINALEPAMQKLSDNELQGLTDKFRERLANGEDLNALIPEAFAAVREASWRVLKMRPFDVQMMGGLALFQGKIAEMKTGESQTIKRRLKLF